jgi:Lon protease-like protein
MASRNPDVDTPLPAELPVFPLSGVLLLPGGRVPLQIFEPRYLALIEDALGAGRMLGMVQPVKPARDPVPDGVALYPVGCAGRIVSFAESDDGRYFVILAGVSRFRIRAELPGKRGYRRIAPDWAPFACDREDGPEPEIDRPRLVKAARAFFAARGFAAEDKSLDELNGPALVTWLAMACPFGASEKQALLECACHAERAETLAATLELAAHEAGGGRPGPGLRH